VSAVFVHAVGLAAPGIGSWADGRQVLAADADYLGGEWPNFEPGGLLPANERRRITPTIRLALQAAADAASRLDGDVARMATVFATSTGDTDLVDRICRALSLPERPVSPTQFHNSVHNAPSGYWAIACGSRMPSATVSAFDASFAAGLLEALAQALVDEAPILLVVYDPAAPRPLRKVAQSGLPFAAALVLSGAARGACDVVLRAQLVSGDTEDRMDDERLEALRTANPASRGLPLLRAIARGGCGRVVLPHVDGRQLAVVLNTP
jgi:hypothetical protein